MKKIIYILFLFFYSCANRCDCELSEGEIFEFDGMYYIEVIEYGTSSEGYESEYNFEFGPYAEIEHAEAAIAKCIEIEKECAKKD